MTSSLERTEKRKRSLFLFIEWELSLVWRVFHEIYWILAWRHLVWISFLAIFWIIKFFQRIQFLSLSLLCHTSVSHSLGTVALRVRRWCCVPWVCLFLTSIIELDWKYVIVHSFRFRKCFNWCVVSEVRKHWAEVAFVVDRSLFYEQSWYWPSVDNWHLFPVEIFRVRFSLCVNIDFIDAKFS